MADDVVKILTPEGGVMTVRGTVIPSDVLDGEQVVGAGGIPILDQLRLLAQWGPLLGLLQNVALAPEPKDKAIAILDALLFASGKTATTVDDEVVKHLTAVLKSPEGAALFNWVASVVKVK